MRPATTSKLEALLNGFREARVCNRQAEELEHHLLRLSAARLLDGFRSARSRWAEEQRKTADGFNLLSVMGVGCRELCHSNLLAWLLDHRIDQGTHAQGNLGFRLFLRELEREFGPKTPCEIAFYAEEPYWVHREVSGNESRADIEIAAKKKFIIHIENKVLAPEGEAQTDREWRDLQRRAKDLEVPETNVHAVFLTLDGTEATNKRFCCVSWNRVARVLDEFAKQAQPPDVKLFACHYAKALRDLTAGQMIEEESQNGEEAL